MQGITEVLRFGRSSVHNIVCVVLCAQTEHSCTWCVCQEECIVLVDDDDANETQVVVGPARPAAGLCVSDVPPLNDVDSCSCTYIMPSNAAADIVDHSPSPAVTSSQSSSTADMVDRSPSPAVTSSHTSSTADVVDRSPSPAVTSSQSSSTADIAETVPEVFHTSQSTLWPENADVTLSQSTGRKPFNVIGEQCGRHTDTVMQQ